jgi:hypothetical protein
MIYVFLDMMIFEPSSNLLLNLQESRLVFYNEDVEPTFSFVQISLYAAMSKTYMG